ncbi:hypothetical protein Pcaca05_05020 [Pectobacterium carotovorum subsp. carotovorum]|nr:hypothetical protein Pcaca05_05020 [Pectobacterium carotovorum subsp. carotovorum]
MEAINYNGTTICVLDDNDMLTDCPINSYAISDDIIISVTAVVNSQNK